MGEIKGTIVVEKGEVCVLWICISRFVAQRKW